MRRKRHLKTEDFLNHHLEDYGIDPQEPTPADARRANQSASSGAAKYGYDDEIRRPESAHSNSNFGAQVHRRDEYKESTDSLGRLKV